jgi:methionyl-tRNA formyltransferase
MRLVFLGTGDIGLPSLEALLGSREHEVIAVVTQPDKPVGRKMVLTPPQVKVRAQAAGILVLQPERIRHALQELTDLRAEVFVVVAYGQILPRAVLDLPKLACLNIHASLLPRHRGAAPIQAAIRDGDAETGVTIMWMNEGLDTGDILLMERLPIAPDDTGGSLHDKLAALAPDALMRSLDLLGQGAAPRTPQDHAQATHVGKLTREDGRVDWSRSAIEIERMIRAFNPWPGAFCLVPASDGKAPLHLKLHRAAVVPHGEACPAGGTVIATQPGLLVSCGEGVIELLEVQLEGKKRMSAHDFLLGCKWDAGLRLE